MPNGQLLRVPPWKSFPSVALSAPGMEGSGQGKTVSGSELKFEGIEPSPEKLRVQEV